MSLLPSFRSTFSSLAASGPPAAPPRSAAPPPRDGARHETSAAPVAPHRPPELPPLPFDAFDLDPFAHHQHHQHLQPTPSDAPSLHQETAAANAPVTRTTTGTPPKRRPRFAPRQQQQPPSPAESGQRFLRSHPHAHPHSRAHSQAQSPAIVKDPHQLAVCDSPAMLTASTIATNAPPPATRATVDDGAADPPTQTCAEPVATCIARRPTTDKLESPSSQALRSASHRIAPDHDTLTSGDTLPAVIQPMDSTRGQASVRTNCQQQQSQQRQEEHQQSQQHLLSVHSDVGYLAGRDIFASPQPYSFASPRIDSMSSDTANSVERSSKTPNKNSSLTQTLSLSYSLSLGRSYPPNSSQTYVPGLIISQVNLPHPLAPLPAAILELPPTSAAGSGDAACSAVPSSPPVEAGPALPRLQKQLGLPSHSPTGSIPGPAELDPDQNSRGELSGTCAPPEVGASTGMTELDVSVPPLDVSWKSTFPLPVASSRAGEFQEIPAHYGVPRAQRDDEGAEMLKSNVDITHQLAPTAHLQAKRRRVPDRARLDYHGKHLKRVRRHGNNVVPTLNTEPGADPDECPDSNKAQDSQMNFHRVLPLIPLTGSAHVPPSPLTLGLYESRSSADNVEMQEIYRLKEERRRMQEIITRQQHELALQREELDMRYRNTEIRGQQKQAIPESNQHYARGPFLGDEESLASPTNAVPFHGRSHALAASRVSRKVEETDSTERLSVDGTRECLSAQHSRNSNIISSMRDRKDPQLSLRKDGPLIITRFSDGQQTSRRTDGPLASIVVSDDQVPGGNQRSCKPPQNNYHQHSTQMRTNGRVTDSQGDFAEVKCHEKYLPRRQNVRESILGSHVSLTPALQSKRRNLLSSDAEPPTQSPNANLIHARSNDHCLLLEAETTSARLLDYPVVGQSQIRSADRKSNHFLEPEALYDPDRCSALTAVNPQRCLQNRPKEKRPYEVFSPSEGEPPPSTLERRTPTQGATCDTHRQGIQASYQKISFPKSNSPDQSGAAADAGCSVPIFHVSKASYRTQSRAVSVGTSLGTSGSALNASAKNIESGGYTECAALAKFRRRKESVGNAIYSTSSSDGSAREKIEFDAGSVHANETATRNLAGQIELVSASDGQVQGDRTGESCEEGSVQCEHCNLRLMNQVTLQNHIKVVHDKCGDFVCNSCDSRFMWKSTLRNHVRLVHERERPYACTHCDLRFRWQSHLDEHVWVVHENRRPFVCSTCGKEFGRKNNMQKHVRRVHRSTIECSASN